MNLDQRTFFKKCRVCNKEGSRNIFEKINRTLESSSLQCVSSNSRLLEKLRFVTMIKIDEFDNKPKMLCDLCIIQLNVSYQFKTLAVEIDGKHQQYLIENGVNHSPNSENSTVHSVEQRTLERSAATVRPITFPVSLSNLQHRRVIKSEPNDYEIMSDITIDTNTDLLEDFPRNGVTSSASNQPFGTSNMVCVSDLDLLRSNGDSDTEFINNCLPSSYRFENPANTVESRQSTTTTTTTTIASKQLVIAASKTTNQSKTVTSDRHTSHNTEVVEEQSSERATVLPRRKRNSTVKFADNEVKKSLRPKSNENIDYSLVRKKRKLINPVNKVKRNNKIKQENDPIKKQSGTIVPKNSSILRNKRRNDMVDDRSLPQFRRGQNANNKEQYRENRKIRRRMVIRETDRFRFASIKTIDSVTSTRN
ncbi:uncharacterized protein LOC119074587 [Bradysia coprophila]|uniref:uncharacterized protein LOC119074587 n=1 Tax=Bradysia coprophila TaxID=38358 RepID=UPI00187DA089|nr:uncharacterized protein LOC119074587 [Bradysia coprophila]